MRRMATSAMRQSRSALGRPLITGRSDEAPADASSPTCVECATGKSPFRLLLCNDDTCEVLLPSGPGCDIRNELRARSLIELTWLARPRTALIVKKPNDEGAEAALCRVAAFLVAEGLSVLVEPGVHAATGGANGAAATWTPAEAASLGQRVDFCVCLGGDGTILWAAGLFRHGVPPVISYAMGSLGFLTPFVIDDHHRSLRMVVGGEFQVTLRARLMCRIIRAADAAAYEAAAAAGAPPSEEAWSDSASYTVLNEVVVDRGPSHSLVELDCWCDGMPMTKMQADGIIVATPTGSTAYSLAAGGSMVHPGISAMLFTPICPHALSCRPLLLPDGVELRVRVPDTSRCTAWAAFDGRGRQELCRGDTLAVRVSPFPVPAVCSGTENEDWFRAAKTGLNWNMREAQKPHVPLPRSYSDASMMAGLVASAVPVPCGSRAASLPVSPPL
jgi:NAD+ kinase